MNPATEQNINEAIDWLQQTGAAVQDFAAAQAPLYCREVVAWELWHGVCQSAAGLVALTIAAVLAWLVKRVAYSGKYPFEKHEFHPNGTFPLMGAVAAAIAAAALIGSGVPRAVKAAVAPRLVIVEHLRGIQNP